MCFFNTPGTKFELYPLDALALDIAPRRSGFGGIALAYNVNADSDIKLAKRRAES